jgi:hypothetical protein
MSKGSKQAAPKAEASGTNEGTGGRTFRAFRAGVGSVLVLAGLVALAMVVLSVGAGDYVSAVLGVLAGLGLCGAGVELLRPVVGE